MKTRRLVPEADCLMRSQLCAGRKCVGVYGGGHTRKTHLCCPGRDAGSFPRVIPKHGGAGRPRELPPALSRTSMAALTAVSEPKLKSVPGTLLLMVAGMTHMMMQSSSYCPRASTSCSTPSYACKQPRAGDVRALGPDPHPSRDGPGCPHRLGCRQPTLAPAKKGLRIFPAPRSPQ